MKHVITLIVGLAIGGGVGVWYGGHHPEAAATEQRDALQARLKVAEAATNETQRELEERTSKPNESHLVSTDSLKHLHDEEQAEATHLQEELNAK